MFGKKNWKNNDRNNYICIWEYKKILKSYFKNLVLDKNNEDFTPEKISNDWFDPFSQYKNLESPIDKSSLNEESKFNKWNQSFEDSPKIWKQEGYDEFKPWFIDSEKPEKMDRLEEFQKDEDFTHWSDYKPWKDWFEEFSEPYSEKEKFNNFDDTPWFEEEFEKTEESNNKSKFSPNNLRNLQDKKGLSFKDSDKIPEYNRDLQNNSVTDFEPRNRQKQNNDFQEIDEYVPTENHKNNDFPQQDSYKSNFPSIQNNNPWFWGWNFWNKDNFVETDEDSPFEKNMVINDDEIEWLEIDSDEPIKEKKFVAAKPKPLFVYILLFLFILISSFTFWIFIINLLTK